MAFDYYLPDTSITSMAKGGKDVYAYVQIMSGALVECQGTVDDVYIFDQNNHVLSRYRNKQIVPDAPKLFTPLAAAYLGDDRVGHP